MSLEQRISTGIMEAMKAKEPVRLQTLRNIKKYIIEAKTSGAGIAELPDADVVKIIAKLAKREAIRRRSTAGRTGRIWPRRSWRRCASCRSFCPGGCRPRS